MIELLIHHAMLLRHRNPYLVHPYLIIVLESGEFVICRYSRDPYEDPGPLEFRQDLGPRDLAKIFCLLILINKAVSEGMPLLRPYFPVGMLIARS